MAFNIADFTNMDYGSNVIPGAGGAAEGGNAMTAGGGFSNVLGGIVGNQGSSQGGGGIFDMLGGLGNMDFGGNIGNIMKLIMQMTGGAKLKEQPVGVGVPQGGMTMAGGASGDPYSLMGMDRHKYNNTGNPYPVGSEGWMMELQQQGLIPDEASMPNPEYSGVTG